MTFQLTQLLLSHLQIGHCSSLTTLSLDLGPVPAEGFTILPRLSRLQHLQLADCPFLPTCLSQLTALEELVSARFRNLRWSMFG